MKLTSVAAALAALTVALPGGLRADEKLAVADGLQVSLEYTLSLADKTEVANNVGGPPLTFVQGSQQVVPGLESALVGLKAGDTKHAEIASKDAFGPYDEKAVMTVKKEQVPPDAKAGTMLSTPDGRPVKVLEVKETDVVLDLNHPLAGKDLVFDIKVLEVSKPEAKPEAPADGAGGEAAPAPAPDAK